MDLLWVYGVLSGYTLNIDKTQALLFNFTPSLDLKKSLSLIGTLFLLDT